MTKTKAKTLKPLTLEGVRALAEAGAVRDVRVFASAEGLSVLINRQFVVATRLKEVRYFSKADTLFGWLKELGITQIHDVDLTNWQV